MKRHMITCLKILEMNRKHGSEWKITDLNNFENYSCMKHFGKFQNCMSRFKIPKPTLCLNTIRICWRKKKR